MRRAKSRGDPFYAMRSAFAGGKDGRRSRLERHDFYARSAGPQRARHAHQHSRGSYAAAEGRKLRPGLLEEFRADAHVALDCVGVVELIGIEGVGLLSELFGAIDHGAEQFGRELSVFGGNDLEV